MRIAAVLIALGLASCYGPAQLAALDPVRTADVDGNYKDLAYCLGHQFVDARVKLASTADQPVAYVVVNLGFHATLTGTAEHTTAVQMRVRPYPFRDNGDVADDLIATLRTCADHASASGR